MIEIQVTNLNGIARMAQNCPAVAQKHIDSAITRSIATIDQNMKPITPVKTGRLRNSFMPTFRPFEGRFGSPVVYARSVHNLYSAGTPYKNPSQNKNAVAGFLEVAAVNAKSAINGLFNDALSSIIEELKII